MNDRDLDAYLQRIGYGGPLAPTADVLVALHEAHVTSIPFENLDILLGRPISLELDALVAKLVRGRRGGYCFEHNTLFRAVLEHVGFDVTSLAARVRFDSPPGSVRPRTHMLLAVALDGTPWRADVGFGAGAPLRPFPIAAGPVEGGAFALRREDAQTWVLEGPTTPEWGDLYAFTMEPQYPMDYVVANWFTSTHPDCHFTRTLTAQLNGRERRAVLRGRTLTVTGEPELTITSPEQLLRVLRDVFGLEFPAGTRFMKW